MLTLVNLRPSPPLTATSVRATGRVRRCGCTVFWSYVMSVDKTILNQLRRARDQRDIALRELEFAKMTRWLWLTIGFVIGGIFF